MSAHKRGKVLAADVGNAGSGNGASTEQKAGKSREAGGVADTGGEDAAGGDERGGREGLDGRSSPGGLKDFVKKMERTSHRIVEMRLGLVGAFGVAFRLLLFDELAGRDHVIRSVFFFVVGEWREREGEWEGERRRGGEGNGERRTCLP